MLLFKRQLIQLPVPPIVAAKWKHQAKTSTKPVVKEKVQEKVVVDKKEVKAVIETKEPVKTSKEKQAVVSEEKQPKAEETCRGSDYYSVSKIVGN
jgi:translation initiation factor IF-2